MWLIRLKKKKKKTKKKKKDPNIYYLQEIHFSFKDTYRLKMSEWKMIFHANGNQKKAGVAILISDKIDFKMTVMRNKQKHSTKIEGSLQ